MRLLQIDYFLEVAEQLNFTSAARNLFISQPALSKQISLLEQELGVKLFERNSRKVALTPAGEQFRKDLQDVREKLDEAVNHVIDFDKKRMPVIRITCFDGRITEDYMTLLYQKINAYDRKLDIKLSITDFQDNTRALMEGRADLMVTLEGDYQLHEGYSCTRLAARKVGLTYSPLMFDEGFEPKIKDFADKPLLVPDAATDPGLRKYIINTARKLGIANPNIKEITNVNVMFLMLERGEGYALVAALVASKNRALRAIELDERFDTSILIAVKNSNEFAKEIFDHVFA